MKKKKMHSQHFNIDSHNNKHNPFEVPETYFENLHNKIHVEKRKPLRSAKFEVLKYAAILIAIVSSLWIAPLLLKDKNTEISDSAMAKVLFDSEWEYLFDLYDFNENDMIEFAFLNTNGNEILDANDVFDYLSFDNDDYYELFY